MKPARQAGPPPQGGLRERLRQAGIRHFAELIHDQDKDWLLKNFKPDERKPEHPVNVARLIRNLLWQMGERIAGGKPPFKELIRTYWYMYVKPTLARADSLAAGPTQYKQLSDNLAELVKFYRVMEYKDIGFRDDNEANRKAGGFANVIVFAEKAGHFDYLSELQHKHDVSIIALGGQPAVLNVEYFVDEIKKSVNLKRSFHLYALVDFDPSGWIIRDSFLADLRHYGIKNYEVFDLINPDMLDKDQILQARVPIPAGKDMEEKNRRWLEAVAKERYANMKYLIEEVGGKTKLYGLEAEAVSTAKLDARLKDIMEPVIGGDERRLKIIKMTDLNEAVKELIVFKTTHPAASQQSLEAGRSPMDSASGIPEPHGSVALAQDIAQPVGEPMNSKPPPTGIIKYTSVKDYIKDVKEMRSKKDAVERIIADFDAALEAVIDAAKRLAQAARRGTILKPDAVAALEVYLQRKDLPWEQTAKEVIKHKPADLGNISAEIRRWIREHEEQERAAVQ